MLVLAMTDMHGNVSHLRELADDLARADVVVISGDVTQFGRRDAAERVIGAVRAYARRVLAVGGNCDHPDVEGYFNDEGVSLHGTRRVVEGVTFLGVGMSLPCPGATPGETTEEGLAGCLEVASRGVEPGARVIVVSHEPPAGTAADLVSGGRHAGSRSVREFIERTQPLACFTGHIHESRGVGLVGRTTVVNPGPQARGFYALARVDEDGVTVELKGD
ncbi:MAG: metallophosphoesterase [Planctomycetota bacterium]